MPTEGAESPWGGAQLTFIAAAMLRHSHHKRRKPYWSLLSQSRHGYLSAPTGLYRHGVSEQLLIMLTPDPTALKEAPDERLSPASLRPCGNILMHCIRIVAQRKGFPAFARADGCSAEANTLRLSLTFNPAHAQQKIAAAICLQAVTVLVFARG